MLFQLPTRTWACGLETSPDLFGLVWRCDHLIEVWAFSLAETKSIKRGNIFSSDQLIYLENANRAFELCSSIRASTFRRYETCSNTQNLLLFQACTKMVAEAYRPRPARGSEPAEICTLLQAQLCELMQKKKTHPSLFSIWSSAKKSIQGKKRA